MTHRTILLIALTALAVGCEKKSVDNEKAEKVIGKWLAELGLMSFVTCPENLEWKTGATFTCEATLGIDGTRMQVVVTQLDDQGHVDWKLHGRPTPARSSTR